MQHTDHYPSYTNQNIGLILQYFVTSLFSYDEHLMLFFGRDENTLQPLKR